MKKILVNTNRAEVGGQVHSLDHVLCEKCHDPNCKVFDVNYRGKNVWQFNPSMLRWCEIEAKSADFPDIEPYLLDASGSPKKVIVDVAYKAKDRHDITYDYNLASGHKISDYIHSAFNSEEGDVYGWPNVNLEPEQVDELYSKGQRTFVFIGSYRGEQIITVGIVETDEYDQRRREQWKNYNKATLDAVKAELLDDLLQCEEEWNDPAVDDYKGELSHIRWRLKQKV
jgi:hypothetical protein